MRRIPQSIAKCEISTSIRIPFAAYSRPIRRAYSTADSSTSELTQSSTPKRTKLKDIKTWDGLQWVGTEEWVRARREPEIHIKKFLNPTKAELDTLSGFIKRTLVEVLALKSMGIRMNEETRVPVFEALQQHGAEYVQGTDIILKNGGSEITVKAKDQGALTTLVAALAAKGRPSSQSFDPNAQEFTVSLGGSSEAQSEPVSWRGVSLQDPDFKFSFVWRLMSLTGTRISDYAIENSNTVGEFHDTIRSTKPKTAKLAEVLEKKINALDLPNVKIEKEPLRMEEKERRQGRWKFIEQELMRRNLPLRKVDPTKV